MIWRIKEFINWALTSKVGNGFAFLLYMGMVLAAGLILKGTFVEISAALFAGLGVQTGQRTYTQVSLTKATLENGKKGPEAKK